MTNDAKSPKRWNGRKYQIRLPVFMLIVAGVALILSAWKFRTQNADMQASWISLQLSALANGSADERLGAAQLLDIVPAEQVEEVIPALTSATFDKEAKVRVVAIKSLAAVISSRFESTKGILPSGRDVAVNRLLACLSDPDAAVRTEAIKALVTIEQTINVPSPDGTTRAVRLGPDSDRVVPVLLSLINDPLPSVAIEAIRAFRSKFDADAKTVIQALKLRSKEGDLRTREEAVIALGAVLYRNGEPTTALMELLSEAPPVSVRLATISAIGYPWSGQGGRWKDAGKAAEFLAQRLKAGDPKERSALIAALCELGITPSHAISALIEILDTDDEILLSFTSQAIQNAKPAPIEALPALARAAANQSRLKQPLRTAEAIIVISPASPEAKAMVPLLSEQLLRRGESGPRRDAAVALMGLGPNAAPAVPALRSVLADVDWNIRQTAATALGMIGPAAKEALPELGQLAQNQVSSELQVAAADALFQIDPGSPEATALLMNISDMILHIEDNPKSYYLKSYYRRRLRSYAPRATKALNRIRELRKTGDERTKAIADEALRQLDPPK